MESATNRAIPARAYRVANSFGRSAIEKRPTVDLPNDSLQKPLPDTYCVIHCCRLGHLGPSSKNLTPVPILS